MNPTRRKLLSSTAIAAAVIVGAAAIGTGAEGTDRILPAFVLAAAASCEPCAACGPCDPCAAAPAANTDCSVPRLQEASANPCAIENPCAAEAACGPCAAANPCAAENPCAAACGPCEPCGPCGPCEAAAVIDVSEEELQSVYECLLEHMRTAYGDDWMEAPSDFASRLPVMQVAYGASELDEARDFVDWENVAAAPYVSATHGERFVTNHVNEAGAEAYRRYEEIGEMPVGGIVAKPSFTIGEDGEARLGPLFLMEKMEAGFHEPSEDWKYTMVMPDGSIGGVTLGQNSEDVEFCIACHAAAPEEQDTLFFLPEHLRR